MAVATRWRSLMVALRTTDTSDRPLLRKALDLADRFGAKLWVVQVLAPSDALVPGDLTRQANKLQRLVEQKRRRRDLQVSTLVVRDSPIADAIIRQVLKHKPNLLIAACHRRGKLSRLIMTQTDWELIRHCPCALWLSKSGRLRLKPRVLAAIDPFHRRAKPARLDDVILRTALRIADGKREQVIACHAYMPPKAVVPAMTGELYWEPVAEEELRLDEAKARKGVGRQLAKYQLPARNVLMVSGEPAPVLVQAVKQQHADVLVMGTISRSTLKRFLIGNTAERVIDDVECDVLVVKPANFRTAVPRQTARGALGYPPRATVDSAIRTHPHRSIPQ